MKLSSEPSGAIEAALDHFEDQWLRSDSPPDVVRAVAALRQFAGFDQRRVAWELAMSDLELRWRHPDPVLRLGSRWYAEHLGPLGLSDTDFDQLSLHELIVRSRWADRPAIDALLDEQYPEIHSEARRRQRRRMVQQLETHFPVHCIVKRDGGSRIRSHVPTPCVFGRQRANDPEPGKPYHDIESGQWRMIVTERKQNRISRNQAIIRRVAVHQISIEPLCKNVGCYLGEQRLPVERPVVLELGPRPHELRFQNITVRFFAD